ncbi:hypothetical protein CRG98_020778 [Punica granatum]|uniref:Retrovirus-related Pol polyprotein from transposon TNT 1-94-like beta-barrel domain-containing protein n=1 Tax=Punica granatum TaxID=22663 RepID=A0A2I0JR73_PUNGR|nr:hypothetical protein CRG98_020778 [Punica granatum]
MAASPCLENADDNHAGWMRTDQHIRSWIFATIAEDLLEEVHDLPTAKAVWDCLQTRFVERTRSRAVDIKILLSRVKLTDQGTNKYLRDLKVLADELREIGKPLSDEDLVTYALAGLPKEYESFVTTNANDRDPLTFETLRTKLTHQEKRLKQFYLEPTSVPVTTQPTALQTHTQTARGGAAQGGGHARGGRGNRGRDRGGRYNGQWSNSCPNWGNSNWTPQMSGGRGTGGPGTYGRGGFYQSPMARDAPFQSPNLVRSFNNPPPANDGIFGRGPVIVICQVCNSPGHTVIQCYELYNHNSALSYPKFLATLSLNDTSTPEAYLDFGASNHMVNTEGILSHSTPYIGSDGVIVGNGSLLSIKSIGSITIPASNTKLQLKDAFYVLDLDYNLVSIQRLCKDNNCYVVFTDSGFFFKDNNPRKTLLSRHSDGSLYPITFTALVAATTSSTTWHCRLGHPNKAVKDPNWRQAMADKFNALIQNGTWSLVPPNPQVNVVGSTWKYRIKYRADGSIE